MGDWTSGAATIHTCPPHRVRRVLDIFAEHDLTPEDAEYIQDTEDTEDDTTLHVGEWYTANFTCGSAVNLSTELINHAPEVAFTVYEQPAYEWVGTICTYVPELGLFTAACDANGDVLLTQKDVLALESQPHDVRHMELGVPWLTAIACMPAETVVEPDRYAAHWDRRHSEIVVVEGAACGGDLVFPAPINTHSTVEVDAALAEQGFRRADDWTQMDETAQLWRTDLYRHVPS
jgi:hypothetical protein